MGRSLASDSCIALRQQYASSKHARPRTSSEATNALAHFPTSLRMVSLSFPHSSSSQAQMAHAYSCDIAERDYSIASTHLELANARRHIKVLEVQQSALNDDLETARTEYEVLVAQLAEEQSSSDAFKQEVSSLRQALKTAAEGLSEADKEIVRLTERADTADGRASKLVVALDASEEDAKSALAQAEARLAEAERREASLEQLLNIERQEKEVLGLELAEKKDEAMRAVKEAAEAARASGTAADAQLLFLQQQQQKAETRLAESIGEAAALRRELAEQRGSSHELQRLLAERDGGVAVLKRQLVDLEGQVAVAEGKYRSGHEGTEAELRGRLQEAERRLGESARELGSKGAALAALERQLGERTAEMTAERERAEEARMRVRELEGELSAIKTQAATNFSDFQGRVATTTELPRTDGVVHNRRTATKMVQDAKEPRTQRKGTKKLPGKAAAPEQDLKAVGVETADLEVVTEEAAKTTVVNVLDHLSLSGYVSPLKKAARGSDRSRMHPDVVGSKHRGNEQRMEDEGKAGCVGGLPEKCGDYTNMTKPRLVEDAVSRSAAKKKGLVTIDINASFDPADISHDDKDDEYPVCAQEAQAAQPRTGAKSVKPMPKKGPAVIGGMRMPLAAIQDTKRAEEGGTNSKAGAGGGKKKRRLLNQGAVPGSDTLPPSLLFGLGDGFKVPKLKH